MSYSQKNTVGSGVTKLTISMWARVPQRSIDKCNKEKTEERGKLFDGIVPLLVMGKKGKGEKSFKNNEQVFRTKHTGYSEQGITGMVPTQISYIPLPPPPFLVAHVVDRLDLNIGASWAGIEAEDGPQTITTSVVDDDSRDTEPSYIGVDCSDPANPKLVVSFETAKKPKVSSASFRHEPFIQSFPNSNPTPFYSGTMTIEYYFSVLVPIDFLSRSGSFEPNYAPAGYDEVIKFNHIDDSDDQFAATGRVYSDVIDFTAEKWHHILVSVEMNDIETHGENDASQGFAPHSDYVDSAARLFVALDDVNYTKNRLSNNWPFDSSDPNAVVTDDALGIAGLTTPKDENNNPLSGTPHYELSNPTISCDEWGHPAQAKFSDKIFMVELAAVHAYLDESIDPASEAIRRLFITKKDKDGVQRPEPRATAEKYFNKKADIKFFSVGAFKNTDVTAGRIVSYTPNANLGGDQGKVDE